MLLLRVGIGLMFVAVHGFPKIAGGVQAWAGLGKTFNSIIGVSFVPALWGFMAAISEFVGGMCLITGVLFRPACAFMLFTMFVAVTANVRGGYGFSAASQALELGIVFLSLIFIGSGRFTLPKLLFSKEAII
ncbi:MAG: DoxX family protein [Pyrinomonadaceae bacterium]